jgi:hypothetical protein
LCPLALYQKLPTAVKTKKAQPTAAPNVSPPKKNQWTALCAARQLVASQPESCNMVELYNEVRTYFQENA